MSFAAPSYSAPPVDAYSLRLITTRRLFDRGTLVSNSPSLANLAVDGVLVANPADLDRLGLTAGDHVRVTSPKGTLTTPVQPDVTVPTGTVVLSWNQGDPSPTVLIDVGSVVTEVRLETTQ